MTVTGISAAAGTSRVFVVVALLEAGGAGTMSSFNASFGGTAMTPIAGSEAISQRCTAKAWYLPNGSIPGAAATLAVTGTHQQTVTGLHIYYATFSGVDQTAPIYSTAANASASTSVTFGTAVNYLLNGMTFYGADNGGTPATETLPTGFTQRITNNTNGFTSFAADAGVHAANGTYANTTTVTFGGTTSTRSAIVVASLRPASTNTTTLGNGTAPTTTGTLCPGGALTDLNAFTFQTSSGTNQVTDVTVTLTPTGASNNVGTLAITNDAGTTTYGSITNPGSDTPVITLSSSALNATTTLTTYHIRLQPKSHAGMPAVPGASYATQGVISAFSCTNTKAGSNTTAASATLTTDNLSTANPAWGTNTAGNTQVVLNWTNPADADFNSVLVLRKAASAITDAPVEGTTYVAGNTIGASTVVYAGTALTFTDTGLTNGTAYYYAIFARDTCGNWSTGAAAGPYTPSAPVPPVTPGVPSAAVNTCTQIVVSAPYTGDTNGNSTTTISRGSTSTGPWTAVCTGLTGASPRTCTDNGVVASTAYYYQVTFADADGVNGTNPQVVGPYTTPACTQNGTTAGTASAAVTGCLEISVLAPFTGDDNGNGSVLVQYNTTNTWPGTTACAAVTGSSPRQCVITTPAAGTFYVRVTYSDADGVSGTAVQVLPGTYATTACGGDTVKPVVTVLTPSRNAVVSGADTFKVQVYDANALDATAPVQFALDGGTTYTTVASPNTNYACGTGCKVYELPVSALTAGSHFVTVRAKDASGNVGQVVWPFQARATTSSGTGTLLRRSSGSQLCIDCHALETHSAQYTSTKYGSWAIDCTTCHTPHKTYNLRLVKNQIVTPNSGTKNIVFQVDDTSGGTNPQNSYLGAFTTDNNATPTDDGVCEACHTKTTHYRNDASGGDHTHNRSQRCVGCHQHGNGFGAQESDGCGGSLTPAQAQCSNCHPTIWQGMTGTVAKNFKHTLGATAGTNDACSDTSITWASPLNGNAAASRSCVNMCHQDHVHNSPAGTTHDYNVHQDATTNATRAVTRGAGGVITAGTPDRTDFNNAITGGGMCLSCHQFPVESGATAAHPAVSQVAYYASAHEGTSTTSSYTPGSAPAHVSSSIGGGTTATVSITLPASPSEGQLMIANIAWSTGTTSNANPPVLSGWTLLSNTGGTGTNPYRRSAILWRLAGPSEPTSHSFVIGGTATAWVTTGAISTFSGVFQPAPIEVVGTHQWNNTASTTNTAPGITTLTNNSLVLFFSGVGVASATHTNWTTATAGAMTEIYDSSATRAMNVGGATLVDATAGATGNGTVTITSAVGAGILLALKPANATAPTNWTYTQHDASTFARNCTKCHADRAEAGPSASSSPFGAVHYSDYPSLLAGSTNPAGTPATFICYNCHGNGTTGQNYSSKDIATQIAKTYSHPANADAVHNTVTEFNNAAFGNTLGVTGRHSSCLDCHNPHEAVAGSAASPGNSAGPPLQGAWGAQLSTSPAFWTDTASTNFTKKTLVAGTDLEATLCFKCHTKYYWGAGTAPTSPSGGFAETDVAKEFNPNNVGNFAGTWASGETAGGFHPVLATAGSNLGAINLANLVTTNFAWSAAARNLMSCSDCHESNSSTDPNGPHGSTASFILRGPNTTWSGTVTLGSTIPAGTFCLNCHQNTFTNSRFPGHSRNDHYVACWNCHAAIPHGGPRPGMLVAGAGAAAGVGGVIAGWDQTSPYWRGGATNRLYIASYPANNTTNWAQGNCGCNGTGH